MNAPATKDLPAPLADLAPPLLPPWLAFVAAGFCFMAAGFRFTVDDQRMYESMNIELPYILQDELDAGIYLALVFVAGGLALLLFTRWHLRTSNPKLSKLARAILGAAAVGAMAVAILVLYSAELIFMRLQASLQQ